MNEFRVFLAVSIFSLSCYFLVDIIVYEFSWALLIASVIGFLSCPYIWPEDHKYESRWYDLLEFVVELPFHTIAGFFRLLGRMVRGIFDMDI